MDERDFQAMQSVVWAKGELQPEAHKPTPTPEPSIYDIYRFAKGERKWYKKEWESIVGSGEAPDSVDEAYELWQWFESIEDWAALKLMNRCRQIAHQEGLGEWPSQIM